MINSNVEMIVCQKKFLLVDEFEIVTKLNNTAAQYSFIGRDQQNPEFWVERSDRWMGKPPVTMAFDEMVSYVKEGAIIFIYER